MKVDVSYLEMCSYIYDATKSTPAETHLAPADAVPQHVAGLHFDAVVLVLWEGKY